jgi:hypothetical protein
MIAFVLSNYRVGTCIYFSRSWRRGLSLSLSVCMCVCVCADKGAPEGPGGRYVCFIKVTGLCHYEAYTCLAATLPWFKDPKERPHALVGMDTSRFKFSSPCCTDFAVSVVEQYKPTGVGVVMWYEEKNRWQCYTTLNRIIFFDKAKISNGFNIFVTQHYLILILICCLVETVHWNKRLFIHPWSTMDMHVYTMQQNIHYIKSYHILQ